MRLVPLNKSDIQIGKEIPWNIYDCHGGKLLSKGVVVASDSILVRLLERGLRDADEGGEAARHAADMQEPPAPSVFDRVAALSIELNALHENLLNGRQRDGAAAVHALAGRLLASYRREPDGMLAAFYLGCEEGSHAERMLHVCVLCELMASWVEPEAAARAAISAAALTYDIGMHMLNPVLNRQAEPLSQAQRRELRAHSAGAVDLLRNAGVTDTAWLDIVHSHHERIDGSGYPRGLRGDDISWAARILAVADIYSAMIRPRAHREALNAKDALRRIFLERGRLVDPELAAVLIKAVGVYPPGGLVRLANGEIAVVVRRSGHATAPKIKSVVGMDGVARTRPVSRDPQDPLHAIIDAVPFSQCRFAMATVRRLWE